MASTATKFENYISGAWSKPTGSKIALSNPATGKVFSEINGASTAEIDKAVSSARKAFNSRELYELHPHARLRLLFRIANEIRNLADEIVPVMVRENGKSVSFARDEVESTAQYFEYFGGVADKLFGKSIPLLSDRKRS